MRLAEGLGKDALAKALECPERLLEDPAARFVKDHRRTAVAAVTVEGREVFVKRFKPYAWYRRIEAAVALGSARRSWANARELAAAGIATAPALACVELFDAGLPADAYFVTAAVPGTSPAGRCWREAGPSLDPAARRRFVEAGARHLRRLHDAGFYTRDANADNALVRVSGGEFEFVLIDLESIRPVRSVSERRRQKNLVQVLRPIRGAVRVVDQIRFVRAYLESGASPSAVEGERRALLREWITKLREQDRRKEAEYRRRARRKRLP